jgi:hypothetical protein
MSLALGEISDRVEQGNVPLVLRRDYLDDYELERDIIASNFSGNAAQIFESWNMKVFGKSADAMWRKRMGGV